MSNQEQRVTKMKDFQKRRTVIRQKGKRNFRISRKDGILKRTLYVCLNVEDNDYDHNDDDGDTHAALIEPIVYDRSICFICLC